MFKNTYSIDLNFFYSKLNENLNKAQTMYTKNYLIKENQITNTMSIFFNIISILNNDTLSNNYEKMKYLYKSFIISPNLNKFPKLYSIYLEQYNDILLKDDNEANKTTNACTILGNLISIASVRKLNYSEERLFFDLLNNSKDIKQKFSLDKDNKILTFDHKVSNNTPNLFDVIEYHFTIKTTLTLDKLKIKSINLFFSNPERNKVKYIKLLFVLITGLL